MGANEGYESVIRRVLGVVNLELEEPLKVPGNRGLLFLRVMRGGVISRQKKKGGGGE